MSITIDWVEDNCGVLFCNASGNVSSDDMRIAFKNVRRYTAEKSGIAHALLDIQHVNNMPGNFMSMLAHHINHAPRNAGLFILLGDNSYVNSLFVTFWRIYPLESEQIKMAASIDDALTLIDTQV